MAPTGGLRGAAGAVLAALVLWAPPAAGIFYQTATWTRYPSGFPQCTGGPPEEIRTVNASEWKTCDAFVTAFLAMGNSSREALGAASETEAVAALARTGMSAVGYLASIGNCVDSQRLVYCYDSAQQHAELTRLDLIADLNAGQWLVTSFFPNEFNKNWGGEERCCGKPSMTLVSRTIPTCHLLPRISREPNQTQWTFGMLECAADGSGMWKYCTDFRCSNCPYQRALVPNHCIGQGGSSGYQKHFCLMVSQSDSNEESMDSLTVCPTVEGRSEEVGPLRSEDPGPWVGFGDRLRRYGWIP
ncbi:hypothetical protein DFJ74DRAFT_692760 [Hyaloraphidium curvatum]|nr:hypothetical protein DFJ74DRAFT_692760 [Hyaloraphidium curvatum]